MSDDRLFASNNAIGRKWYFLNIIILALIIWGTHFVFKQYILTHVTSDVYGLIAKGFQYFIYAIYTVTFFALIERRLYDATGTRDAKSYRNTSSVLSLTTLIVGAYLLCKWQNINLPIPEEILTIIVTIATFTFIVIAVVLMFLKGKISNLSYEQYRRKIKYE